MRIIFIFLLGMTLLFSSSIGLAYPINTTKALTERPANGQHHPGYSYKQRYLFENNELLTLLKMDAVQLKTELNAGKSLSDIAVKQGIKPQAVLDLLTKQANQRLEQAVKDGRMNQEQAQLRKNVMRNHLKEAVEGKGFYTKEYKSRGHRLEEAAAIIGMTSGEMIQQLNNGKSIGELAEEKGVSKKKLIKSLLEKEKEYITQWVERTW